MTSPVAALFLVLVLWISLTLLCCAQGFSNKTHKVKYIVSGATSSASLTYENEHGNTEQISKAKVPIEIPVEMRDGAFLYISAQNQEEYGSIVTEIEVDGKSYNRTTSQGGYVIATSSMRCCPQVP